MCKPSGHLTDNCWALQFLECLYHIPNPMRPHTLPGKLGGHVSRHRTYECLRVGDRPGNQVSTTAPSLSRALSLPKSGLQPSSGFSELYCPSVTPQVSNLQSKKPQALLGWPQCVPLSKRPCGLTPEAAGQPARRGVCFDPPQPRLAGQGEPWAGAAECDLLSPGWIGKCQAPIKQPCSGQNKKRAVHLGPSSLISSFPISPGLAMV